MTTSEMEYTLSRVPTPHERRQIQDEIDAVREMAYRMVEPLCAHAVPRIVLHEDGTMHNEWPPQVQAAIQQASEFVEDSVLSILSRYKIEAAMKRRG